MSDLSETLGIASHRFAGGRVAVRPAGVLDSAGAARLIDAMTRIDPCVGDRVVLHLDDVTFLDSACIGALCYAEAFVRARGGQFSISPPSPRVHAMLELAGLGRCSRGDDDIRPTPEAGQRRSNPPSASAGGAAMNDGADGIGSTLDVTRTNTPDGVRLTAAGQTALLDVFALTDQFATESHF